VDVLLASEVLYNTGHYDDLCALVALLLVVCSGARGGGGGGGRRGGRGCARAREG
jgi:hypothetical protein